jgi:hypothetical protein
MEAAWLTDLWAGAKEAGAFGAMIMTLLWYLERKDRLKLQEGRDALLERVLKALEAGNTVLDNLKEAIKELRK